jgi:hypothetical protein
MCVTECDREVSIIRRPWPTGGFCVMGEGGNMSLLPYIRVGLVARFGFLTAALVKI